MNAEAESWKDRSPHRLMYRCPRWGACNAAFCPLGAPPGEGAGKHARGDAVCFFMREFVKAGGPERVAARLDPEQQSILATVVESVMASGGVLAGPLGLAASTSSRVEAGQRILSMRAAGVGNSGNAVGPTFLAPTVRVMAASGTQADR